MARGLIAGFILLQQGHALSKIHARGHRGKTAARLTGITGKTFYQQGAAAHVNLQANSLPIGGVYLRALQLEPSAFVEAAEDSVSEVEIFLDSAFKAGEALRAGIDPESAAHGVEDAGFNGVGRIGWVGAEAETVAAILFAVVVIEEGVGQQGKNSSDTIFVFFILTEMLCLFVGRSEETLKARLILGLSLRVAGDRCSR